MQPSLEAWLVLSDRRDKRSKLNGEASMPVIRRIGRSGSGNTSHLSPSPLYLLSYLASIVKHLSSESVNFFPHGIPHIQGCWSGPLSANIINIFDWPEVGIFNLASSYSLYNDTEC